MTVALQFWFVSSVFVSAVSFLIGAVALLATAGSRDEGEAKFILGCFGVMLTSPLWPALLVGGLGCAARGLWSDADLPTLAQRRERRRTEVAVQRDRRVREQAATIARLEREAGIR